MSYCTVEYIRLLVNVGVNIFILITGYFLIGKEFKISRILSVWIQTVFYAVIFALIFYIIYPEQHTLKDVIKSVFPIHFKQYWFVSEYIGLLLLAPFLSIIWRNLSCKSYRALLVVLSIMGLCFKGYSLYAYVYGFNSGYTLLWFITLFFISGYIRKYDIVVNRNMLGLFFSLGVIGLGLFLGMDFIVRSLHQQPFCLGVHWIGYNDILTLTLSIILFLNFKQKKFKETIISNVMVRIAPYTFGVYLIHDNIHIREWLWSVCFDIIHVQGNFSDVFYMLLTCTIIFSFCILIDYIRTLIFSILHIRKALDILDGRFERVANVVNSIQ